MSRGRRRARSWAIQTRATGPACILAAIYLSCLSVAATARGEGEISPLPSSVTEEGQRVVFDGYSWQRRELTKRLPLDQPWPVEDDIGAVLSKYGLDKIPIPATIPTPALIVPGVYLVGSHPNNTYLIDCGSEGTALIDPGLVSNYDSIIANIEQLGFSPQQIRWVLNTHAHFDHSMADGLFQQLGAKVLIGTADAAAVEKATRVTGRFFLPAEIQADYPKIIVDWPVADGEMLELGNRVLHVIHTPGHTAGSSAFLLQLDGKNIVFTGDTLLYDYRLGFQGTAYADDRAYVASLEKLATFTLDAVNRISWDILLPGHGVLVLERAYMDIQKGWRQVQIDLLEGTPVDALPFATQDYRQLMFGRPLLSELPN